MNKEEKTTQKNNKKIKKKNSFEKESRVEKQKRPLKIPALSSEQENQAQRSQLYHQNEKIKRPN